jgi:hypothetical protein
MKNILRICSALFAIVLCMSLLAACGETAQPTEAAPTTVAPETSAPFVAPPDQIGEVISADAQLFTWKPFDTKEDVIDFKSVNIKELGETGEMTLVYMEQDLSFYSLVGGKLEAATIYDVVPGAIVGITTLEEGVQEVYILSVPSEDVDDEEDILEDVPDEVVPSETQFSEPSVPDDSEMDDSDIDG